RLQQRFPELPISDFHLWRVGRNHYACIVAVSGGTTHTPAQVKDVLLDIEGISHLTIEINPRVRSDNQCSASYTGGLNSWVTARPLASKRPSCKVSRLCRRSCCGSSQP